MKKILGNLILGFTALAIALLIGEGLLILKNRDMKNYDIEMWRYSKLIKKKSDNPILGYEHRRHQQATLGSIQIRTNNFGLRGPDIHIQSQYRRRILFLGSSVTLGWGVPESATCQSILADNLGKDTEVLNAGICNYNTVRYVELFMTKLAILNPTDIVLHYFINDTEVLRSAQGNWFMRHSQFAVTLWQILNRALEKNAEQDAVAYYKTLYQKDAPGYKAMLKALDRIKAYADAKKIQVYFIMVPDFYNLTDYKYTFIHKLMKNNASKRGFQFVDLLPLFKGMKNSKSLWVSDIDPHPNDKANQLMAEYLIQNAFLAD